MDGLGPNKIQKEGEKVGMNFGGAKG